MHACVCVCVCEGVRVCSFFSGNCSGIEMDLFGSAKYLASPDARHFYAVFYMHIDTLYIFYIAIYCVYMLHVQ